MSLSKDVSHILVVDDNRQSNEMVQSLLRKEGYRVVAAFSGSEALLKVSEAAPDLILLDAMMPDITGFEVARTLRADPENHFCPILMLTALRDLQDKVKGLAAGADDFLSKPFNTVELLARVRSLLRIKKLHDEVEAKNALLERILMRYISKEVALQIMRDPEQHLKLGGEVGMVSVLFADIRGFTTFSESRKAKKVILVLNKIFGHLTPLVFAYQGTLDKYLGDAIMALYGAPLACADSVKNAVHSAWMMQRSFTALRANSPELSDLGLGIGICTGEAIIGNVGTKQFMDYTVIGSIPNLAKRLQENASAGQILIDEETNSTLRGEIRTEAISPFQYKGFHQSIPVYTILSIETVPTTKG
ncbi:MAG: adenylate/guanylate cyclase domain-containing protein [Chloroflexota bacterium]|nr:adenylate/guanylate cyclase domain-containing protein [Chloroflexota bacterium]